MKGFTLILILGVWLGPSAALPDFLAPFKSMLGIKSSSSGGSSYGKALSSSKDPSASHSQKHYGGPPQSEDDDPFQSNFGFGRPPSNPQEGSYGPGPGGPSPHSSPYRGSPYAHSPPRSQRPSSGSSRPIRQQPGPGYQSYRPGGGPGGAGSRPSSPYSQSQGSQYDHQPRPNGPPSHSDNGPESQDDTNGPSVGGGPSGSPFQRRPSPYSQQQDDYQSGPPDYQQGGPGGPYQGGPGGPGPYQGGPGGSRPFQGSSGGPGPYEGSPGGPGPFSGPQSDDGQDNPSDGPGFGGFGSFPGGQDEEDDSPPPPGASSGPRGPPSSGPRGPPFRSSGPRPFRPSRPGPSYDASSSPPSRFPGGQGPSEESSGPFFGGPQNDYPEQFDGGNRGTRQPEIITADDVTKYPAQINDDEEQPQGPGFGPGPGGPVYGRGPPPQSNSAPWGAQGSPFGGEDSPPSYQSGRPRFPSGSGSGKTYSYTRPVSAGYQTSAESVHYGKPMMMAASNVRPVLKVPRGQRKRFSAKVPKHVVPLSSPKDPNYRGMGMASSVNAVSTPYEPDTASSGHGHGGYEGLSHNGDRILYHVSGHQGPYSYRFGYDTGKGYNRLFRFEEKDGKGYVKGKYGFYDKHGKMNVINYEAHPKHGFHAERGHAHGHY